MIETVTVPPTDIIRVTARVDGDANARITLSYVNADAPNEDDAIGPRPRIDKKMVFNETCLHSLIFAATGDPDADGASMKIRLVNTRTGNSVVYEPAAVPLAGGVATHQVWVTPA